MLGSPGGGGQPRCNGGCPSGGTTRALDPLTRLVPLGRRLGANITCSRSVPRRGAGGHAERMRWALAEATRYSLASRPSSAGLGGERPRQERRRHVESARSASGVDVHSDPSRPDHREQPVLVSRKQCWSVRPSDELQVQEGAGGRSGWTRVGGSSRGTRLRRQQRSVRAAMFSEPLSFPGRRASGNPLPRTSPHPAVKSRSKTTAATRGPLGLRLRGDVDDGVVGSSRSTTRSRGGV